MLIDKIILQGVNEKVKNLILITGTVLLAGVIISSVTGVNRNNSAAESKHNGQTSSTEEKHIVHAQTGTHPYYTIKSYNNRVAVFKNDDIKPYFVSDTNVNDLPQQDTEEINSGIVVADEKKLKRLIEDYCG